MQPTFVGEWELKISEVRATGLRGATPKSGWSNEVEPDDGLHTLVTVHTDEGLVGLGSVFTSEDLVRGALSVLEPLYQGENALEPERVSEKLHQNTFWQGHGATGGETLGRTLQGSGETLRLAAHGGAGAALGAPVLLEGAGFQSLQD